MKERERQREEGEGKVRGEERKRERHIIIVKNINQDTKAILTYMYVPHSIHLFELLFTRFGHNVSSQVEYFNLCIHCST